MRFPGQKSPLFRNLKVPSSHCRKSSVSRRRIQFVFALSAEMRMAIVPPPPHPHSRSLRWRSLKPRLRPQSKRRLALPPMGRRLKHLPRKKNPGKVASSSSSLAECKLSFTEDVRDNSSPASQSHPDKMNLRQHRLRSACFQRIAPGVRHPCNADARKQNIDRLLTQREKELIASEVLQGKDDDSGEIVLQTGGRSQKAYVSKKSIDNFQYTHQEIENLTDDLNVTGMHPHELFCKRMRRIHSTEFLRFPFLGVVHLALPLRYPIFARLLVVLIATSTELKTTVCDAWLLLQRRRLGR